tara:strand:- start:8157 stop:8840 length:684 start_codon:yes stop_codon:yes gene_type:complete
MACTSSNLLYPQYTINSILPRESFVKVEVIIFGKDEKQTMELGTAAASGSIIRETNHGSYILTAQHVCEISVPRLPMGFPQFEYLGVYKVYDIDNIPYETIVFKESNKIDACIMFAKNLKNKPTLKLREKPPEIGDMSYNIAAPAGFFDKNMIPLFQGRYSGRHGKHDIYTIPATGGSSGSPIVNKKGQLIGMVFAVHRRFSHISFSPTTKDLYDFIDDIKKAPHAP